MVEQCAVLGVDGCRGGWVGALVTIDVVRRPGPERPATMRSAPHLRGWYGGDFTRLLAVPADLLAVDIPIGLPSDGRRRSADEQARAVLGPARSSVFFAPPRIALQAGSQAQASALSRSVGGKGVSIQTYWILGRMAEVDAALDDPVVAGRVIETHPEVSFRALVQDALPTGAAVPTTGPVLPRKKLGAGRAARLQLLRGWLPDLELPVPRPPGAAVDDCLDALACAWSGVRALTGRAEVLGGDHDERGRPMRIVV